MSIRLHRGDRIVVATHNAGKVREIDGLLAPFGVRSVSAKDLGLPVPEETGTTFAANARIKAIAAAKASGLVALSDDSGLEVAALDGAPGVHAADWAGPDRDFRTAMQRLQRELEARGAVAPEQRRANFISVLCLARPDGSSQTFEGRVDGHLVWPPRGNRSFGYSPMFVPDGETRTFGELGPDGKADISHRARAFARLIDQCLR
jgi:XTP/dITP diphosphohydrolase